MVPPTVKSADHPQISERRHSDPPGLWAIVVLTSVVIHVFAIGMLRLLVIVRLDGLLSGTTIVPIDVIDLSPNATSSTQSTRIGGSVPTRKPTPINAPTQRASNQLPNRPNPSVSNPSSTRTNASPSQVSRFPQDRRSPAPKPSANQPPYSPPESISPKPSANQPPYSPPEPTSPNPSPSQPPNPSPEPTSPNPSPSQPPNPSPEPTSPNPSPSEPISPSPQPSGSFSATIGGMRLTVPDKDVPDKNARLKQSSTTNFPIDYLTTLGINSSQVLVLKVKVLIESTGQATVLPNSAEVSPGNISPDKAEQLAKQIIEKWSFEPAYMGDSPVRQAYNIELNISPL